MGLLRPGDPDTLLGQEVSLPAGTPAAVDDVLAVGPTTGQFRPRTPAQIKALLALAAVATSGSASDITTGTLPDSVIPAGIARDAEVSAAVAALGDSAPAALDTLNELAAALGDDANYAATVTAALNARVTKGSQVFNVRDYGATGSGSGNDATGVQAAITAAVTAGGGTVFLPAGTYRVTAAVSLKSKVNIVGAGRGVTVIQAATGVTTAVLVGFGSDTVSDAFYRDFAINGGYTASTGALSVSGIQISTAARLTFSKLATDDTGGSGILTQTGSMDCLVEHCRVTNSGKGGGTAAHAISVAGGSHRNRVIGNWVTAASAMGIGLGAASACTDCEVIGNYVADTTPSATGFEGIGLTVGCDRTVVSHNQVINTQDNGISVSSGNNTVTGNIVDGALNHGIHVGGQRNTVVGNVIKNVGKEVSATPFAGISLPGSSSSQNNIVQGNTVYDDQGTKTTDYGIAESAGANNNLITGNVCRAADVITAGIVTVGSQTVSTNNITAPGLDALTRAGSFGFPASIDTAQLRGTDSQTLAANRAVWHRVRDGGSISGVQVAVVVASGNISVGVYSNTGTGRSAAPGAPLAVTGSVACPAVGDATIPLGSTVTVAPGDWIAVALDNVTAALRSGLTGIAASGLGAGRSYYKDASFPLPASAPTGLTAAIGGPIALIGA